MKVVFLDQSHTHCFSFCTIPHGLSLAVAHITDGILDVHVLGKT